MEKLRFRCNTCREILETHYPIDYLDWWLLRQHLSTHGLSMDSRFDSLRDEREINDTEVL